MTDLKLTLDPSPPRTRRSKTNRNLRIAAAAVAWAALLMSTAVVGTAYAACGFVGGMAVFGYGAATMLSETATFPKWLYAAIALFGGWLASTHAIVLFS